MEIHRIKFPTNSAGFCKEEEAWPLSLNEWKWPTQWTCMNLNRVTKGILCNRLLFDLETAPLLIGDRTGDGCAHWALRGERNNGVSSSQPESRLSTRATHMQSGAGGADTHTHLCTYADHGCHTTTHNLWILLLYECHTQRCSDSIFPSQYQ